MSGFLGREHGVKHGGGGIASSQHAEIARKERLRKLALETLDLKNDPYLMKNHLGGYECKLCLTLHTNESSYLSHTQGKRHQENLAKRAARIAKEKIAGPVVEAKKIVPKKTIKIGRPGYKIVKLMDKEINQRALLFQIQYPKIEEGIRPRFRFMSAYEQRVEPPNDKFQFLLFAAEPYEVISFKIPNQEIDKRPEKFLTNWDEDTNVFTLQLHFKPEAVERLDHTRLDAGAEEYDINDTDA